MNKPKKRKEPPKKADPKYPPDTEPHEYDEDEEESWPDEKKA